MDSTPTIQEQSRTLFKALASSGDIDQKTGLLRQLIGLKSPEVTRTLIDLWVGWIALDEAERQPLIMTAARELRTEPDAVHPLVDHFAHPLDLTVELKQKIIQDAIEPGYKPLIKAFKPALFDPDLGAVPKHEPDNHDRQKALELLDSLANRLTEAERSPEYEDLKRRSKLGKWETQTVVDESLNLLFEEERLRREKLVYRGVSGQLAHMSDERFYDAVPQNYQRVRDLLEIHAVPVIAFNLPKHTDLETRWRIGLMLGYVGGRVAVDELVTALIDEKSTRDARQNMLSVYYLEPAKRQSQQAAQILSTAVEDARSTMRTLRILNICVFVVGIGLVITAVYLAAHPGESSGGNWKQYSGFFTFIGGLGTILSQLFFNPLNRIQNSIANLVQLETAFTNFIWELNLNGAYIQSRYVADGKLTDYEISQTVQRMQKSMALTMKQIAEHTIAKHTEVVEEKLPPDILNIEQVTGKPGDNVEIHG